ncbi:MAG: PepSY domain-containing protein [Rhodanobacter sp.]
MTAGFSLAIGTLSMTSGCAMAQATLTAPQVQSKLTEQAYTKINDVKFKDGMWRAEAKSASGDHINVRIDAKTGQVSPDKQVSKLSKQDVRAALETQGLHRCPRRRFQ